MRAGALAFLGVLGGCGADPTPDAGMDAGSCSASPAHVTLGTGADGMFTSFRALSDGDTVYLTPGPQGGQHVWTGLRGRGFDPGLPRIELRAYRVADNALIGRLRIRLPMSLAPEDTTLVALGQQTLQIDDTAYCSVLGADLRIELDFDDETGHCATARRTVHLADLAPGTPDAIRAAWLRCCSQHLPRCFPDASVPYTPADGGLDAAPSD